MVNSVTIELTITNINSGRAGCNDWVNSLSGAYVLQYNQIESAVTNYTSIYYTYADSNISLIFTWPCNTGQNSLGIFAASCLLPDRCNWAATPIFGLTPMYPSLGTISSLCPSAAGQTHTSTNGTMTFDLAGVDFFGRCVNTNLRYTPTLATTFTS
jgi:hypothetical protein